MQIEQKKKSKRRRRIFDSIQTVFQQKQLHAMYSFVESKKKVRDENSNFVTFDNMQCDVIDDEAVKNDDIDLRKSNQNSRNNVKKIEHLQ